MHAVTYPPQNETSLPKLGDEIAGVDSRMRPNPSFRVSAVARPAAQVLWLSAAVVALAAGSAEAQTRSTAPSRPGAPPSQRSTGPASQRATASPDLGSTQPRSTAVLFNCAGATAGSPIDPVIQGAVEALGVVDISSRPGMDLGAVQLALDCVAETTHCLNSVTTQSGVQQLIAPTLQRTPTEMVLSVLRFDARGGGKMRRVVRRQAGRVLGAELLDAVPEMMRELFELPPAAKKKEPEVPLDSTGFPRPNDATEAPAPDASLTTLPEGPDEPPSWRVPAAPIVLGSVGLLVIGGGIAAGVLANNEEQKFNRLVVDTRSDADAAEDTRSKGRTQAVLANVMFGVGGAAVLAAGIWLIADYANASSRRESFHVTSIRPIVGPQQLGLVLTHRGSSL
jgi:hypothetical protein